MKSRVDENPPARAEAGGGCKYLLQRHDIRTPTNRMRSYLVHICMPNTQDGLPHNGGYRGAIFYLYYFNSSSNDSYTIVNFALAGSACVHQLRGTRYEIRGARYRVRGMGHMHGARGMRHVVCGTRYVVCSAGELAWVWLGDLGAQRIS